MGQAGRRHVLRGFRIDEVVGRWEDLYASLGVRRPEAPRPVRDDRLVPCRRHGTESVRDRFPQDGNDALAEALRLLGYRVTGPNGVHRKGMNTEMAMATALELLPKFDAFQDNPWADLFRRWIARRRAAGSSMTVGPRGLARSVVGHFGQPATDAQRI